MTNNLIDRRSAKIKEAAIEFLAEIEAQLKGWQDEYDSQEKVIRVNELQCILNCVGAIDLRKALGAVAVRKIHKRAANWWKDAA